MVELISQMGPNIPEIARRLGQFKESVRYRYREKILNRGLTVQGAVDHERLGLRRVVFVADFGKAYEEYAQSILAAMSELCYVTGFARAMPGGEYLVNASVPVEHVEGFTKFLDGLEARGLFRNEIVAVFDWYRMVPMRAECYDFSTGRWDFDWSNLGKPEVWRLFPPQSATFDYADLLILKELSIDATRPMIDVAKKLGASYKKLAWHFKTHVKARKLLRGYTLNWVGTSYDFKIEKALHRRHRYLTVDLLVCNLSEVERMGLMSRTNQLPFLWAEAGGRNYWAQFAFPIDNIVEAYQHLQGALRPIRDRARLLVTDPTNALSFTISYKLYDERSGAWSFNSEELLAKFDELLLKIRSGAG